MESQSQLEIAEMSVDGERQFVQDNTLVNTLDLEAENTTPLHFASFSSNEDDLNSIIEQGLQDGIDLDAVDGNGRTPLIYTVISNAVKCTEVLLLAGADINGTDGDGRTSVHWAAFNGNHKMMKYLLNYGADATITDTEGRQPLHLATGVPSSKCLRYLLKCVHMEVLDMVDGEGMAAIHWSAFHNHPKHIDALLSAGATLTLADGEGKTALHWCSGHTTVLTSQMLIQQYPTLLTIADGEGRIPLHLAIADHNAMMASFLIQTDVSTIDYKDNMARTPLHWAAVLGQVDVVNLLLHYGANCLDNDASGANAFHYAAQNENTECLSTLLAYAENSNWATPDNEQRTPIMWAAGQGNVEAIHLIAGKSDVHSCDLSGGNAMHMAAYAGNAECIRVLAEYGVSVDALDNQKHTPLFRACEMGHTDAVAALLAMGASVTLVDVDGRSLLHWAALGGSDYICAQLVERGVDIDLKDAQGRTALQCASYGGFLNCMSALCRHGADVNVCDNEGITALHWASSAGLLEGVQLLIEHHAFHSPREIDGEQLTPLDYAMIGDENGQEHTAVVEYLVSKRAVSITSIKHASAAVIQASWRGFKAKQGGIGEVSAPPKTFKPVVRKPRQMPKPIAAPTTDIVASKDYGKSVIEKERARRELRIKERKLREIERAKEDARRAKEEKDLQQRRQQILARSMEIKDTAARERRRIAEFRDKQKAARTIQDAFKEHLLAPQSKKTGDTHDKTAPHNYRGPSKMKYTLAVTEKQRTEAAESLSLKELRRTQNLSPTWQRTIAALTIQLHWRQYARRKALERAARRQKALHEWSPSVLASKQRTRVASVYGRPLVMQQYQPAERRSMRRPSDTPSAAVKSYKFAVERYVHAQHQEKKIVASKARGISQRQSPSKTKRYRNTVPAM